MFHMLSSFNLKPGEEIQVFSAAYLKFVEEMKAIDLVESSGPIGLRQSNTPMDTDDDREHQYFSVMTFRDRQQVDAAYNLILQHSGQADAAHDSVYSRVQDSVFTCWQDLDPDTA